MTDLITLGQRAQEAAGQLAVSPAVQRNAALSAIADALEQQAEGLLRDGEYLRWRAQRFSSPVFTGREIRPAKAP